MYTQVKSIFDSFVRTFLSGINLLAIWRASNNLFLCMKKIFVAVFILVSMSSCSFSFIGEEKIQKTPEISIDTFLMSGNENTTSRPNVNIGWIQTGSTNPDENHSTITTDIQKAPSISPKVPAKTNINIPKPIIGTGSIMIPEADTGTIDTTDTSDKYIEDLIDSLFETTTP